MPALVPIDDTLCSIWFNGQDTPKGVILLQCSPMPSSPAQCGRSSLQSAANEHDLASPPRTASNPAPPTSIRHDEFNY
ncbi:unnamed protein product [Rotaria sp. Silwood1]|nr:unnamed protein product [Rotaria sp. Silwood1]